MTVTPKPGEAFTEFYILNENGKAEDYPRNVILGESMAVIIGVVNHEFQPASYRVSITVDDIQNSWVDIGTLAHNEKYERRISFTPAAAGKNEKVNFYLYRDDQAVPYHKEPLRLYIDVTP